MDTSTLFYKVAPLSSNVSGPHPTLMFLHGRGTDENDLLSLSSVFDPRLLMISIRAPYKFPFGGYTWFDLDEHGGINKEQLMQGCAALMRCLDEIQQNFPVDKNRVFLFGFSMGAMISLAASLAHPDRFRGIIAHSGLLPNIDTLHYRWNDLATLSFLILHGTDDPIIPITFARQAHQRIVDAHADVVYHEYHIPHTISEESMQDAAGWLQEKLGTHQ
jgi:phospholipase/carboxylesterase